jgi:hypothetical protein
VTKAIEDGGDLNLLVPRLNELGLRQQDLASSRLLKFEAGDSVERI